MELHSLSFLFLFLPLTLAAYYLAPGRAKSAVLLVASLVFYALLQPIWLPVMVVSVIADYCIALGIHRLGRADKRSTLLIRIAVVKALGMIVLVSATHQIYGSSLPLGIYIYLLTSLGYLLDFYRGEVPFEPSLINYGVFCCFFGKLNAGPLVEYREVGQSIAKPELSLVGLGQGLCIFIRGLAKKVLVADGITEVYLSLKAIPATQLNLAGGWALVFTSIFSIYFTLSSYCDMARGLGRCFGMELPFNFRYPLEAGTINDFFSRFNTTVSRFIRKHVYLALGSDQHGKLSASLNLLLIAMLMGLWFGLQMNYLAWGACLGLLLIAESLWLKPLLEHIPPFFVRIITFAATLLSFAVFSADSLETAWLYLRSLVGLGASTAETSNQVLYLLSSHYTVIVLCFLISSSLMTTIGKKLAKRYPTISAAGGTVIHLGLLTAAVAFLL